MSTSNRAPDKLYEGGLQRSLFLPFIAKLKVPSSKPSPDSLTYFVVLLQMEFDSLDAVVFKLHYLENNWLIFTLMKFYSDCSLVRADTFLHTRVKYIWTLVRWIRVLLVGVQLQESNLFGFVSGVYSVTHRLSSIMIGLWMGIGAGALCDPWDRFSYWLQEIDCCKPLTLSLQSSWIFLPCILNICSRLRPLELKFNPNYS